MSDSPSLPTGPFEYAAMDYARLRAQGVELLGRLAGTQWSDFNTHDPGVTILEQLCYAITDLGYRIDFPIADLLAGDPLDLGLPGPSTILSCDPVTATDLRKLALDVEGIGNAWVETRRQPELVFHYHPGNGQPGSGELRLQPDIAEVDARPIRLHGLSRVLLQTGDPLTTLPAVAARLHRARGLGADFEVVALGPFPITIEAEIEVGPIEDPAAVVAAIISGIEAYLAPPVRFSSQAELLAQGHRVDEIFEGPTLERGVVLGRLPELQQTIYVSDLIHAITDVPAVRAVRSCWIRVSDKLVERWTFDIPAGQVATVAPNSKLSLRRAGLALAVDPAELAAHLVGPSARPTDTQAPALQPPIGRDRKLARYSSIQHQLPAVYGVGLIGLPADAPASRRAQARQLEAYLLVFDQLLANAFAQLAHARDLLSPGSGPSPTYFAAPVEDPRLRLDELLVQAPAPHRAWLAASVTPAGPIAGSPKLQQLTNALAETDRHKRFLAHLLARFGEQLGDHAQIRYASKSASDDLDQLAGRLAAERELIADRQAFLRDYPRLSSTRGSGHDLFESASEPSGLEQRIRIMLGLGPDEHPEFHLVEHVLLRPIAEDAHQLGAEGDPPVPLLAGLDGPDPWSLQVSYVFEDLGLDPSFDELVARTILEQTPAHLTAKLRWFGAREDIDAVDHWSPFTQAWSAFRVAHRNYRAAQLHELTVANEIHLRFRDARDRVIDLLELGRTYPLRDLPHSEHLIVAPGKAAMIAIEFTQVGVRYELRDRRTGDAIKIGIKPITAEGTGGTIKFKTPPIDVDVSYRILAVKLHEVGGQLVRHEAWLHGAITIEEGIDTTLVTQIRLVPQAVVLLDTSIDDEAKPSDARIVDYGLSQVEVEIFASQEGVDYELLDDANHATVLSTHKVIGTGKPEPIVLQTKVIGEDVDLRVRGSRKLGDPQHPEFREALLDQVLPLRIRANPALVPALATGPAVDHGAGATLRLSGTQTSASYQVWRRRLRDDEFVYGPTNEPTLELLADGRSIRVLQPSGPQLWQVPAGCTPLGSALAGTGNVLDLPLGPQVEDTLLIVQASKLHRADLLSDPIDSPVPRLPSAVRLDRVQVQLVRPDRAALLRLQVELVGAATSGPLLVQDGQPGVFYQLQPDGFPALTDLAYFHQRDRIDSKLNKGIGQLRAEVDLVIARTPTTPVVSDLATTPALSPLVESKPLPVLTKISVLARRATTGLEATLQRQAQIGAAVQVTAKSTSVKLGEGTLIVIEASVVGEIYRLLDGDAVITEAKGGGAALEFETGPLAGPTVFVVAIVNRDSKQLEVERRISVPISITP